MKISEIQLNDLIVVGENITKVNNIFRDYKGKLLFDCFIGFIRENEIEGKLIPIDDEESNKKEIEIFEHCSSILEKKINEFNFNKFKILNGSINCDNLNEYESLKLMNQLTIYVDKVLTNEYQIPTLTVTREDNHLQINYRILQY